MLNENLWDLGYVLGAVMGDGYLYKGRRMQNNRKDGLLNYIEVKET